MDTGISQEAARHSMKIGFGMWIAIVGLIAATIFVDDKMYVLIAGVILVYYRLSALHVNSILILDSIDRSQLSANRD